MGVLSDLVVAGENDAELVCRTLNPSATFAGIDIKGIDSVKFESLDQILTGRAPTLTSDVFTPLACGFDEGRLVFRLPGGLVGKRAALSSAEQTATADLWFKTEGEFHFGDWQTEAVLQVLAGVCALARSAVAQHKVLYLWMSL